MFADYDPSHLIKRLFGITPDKIAPTVILAPAKRIVAGLESQLQNPLTFGNWFTGTSGYLDDELFITVLNNIRYAPGMADCVYFLQFAGVKNLIYTGSIGGLAKGMKIGDFILVKESERGDGASGYFSPIYDPAMADQEFLDQIRPILQATANEEGYQFFEGRIFTTDSLGAETVEFLRALQTRGFLGIEMETSALYVVARCAGMRAVAAHVISDLPLEGKTLFDEFTDAEKERRASAYLYLVNTWVKVARVLASEER
jgi:purine-nucleoside phosphorylase